MMTISLKDKLRGCLIGQCLGDALGFPVEGQNQSTCSFYIYEMVSQWFDGAAPPGQWTGQYTDDSQLARELLESLVKNHGFDPEDYSRRIADICGSNRIVGRGIATEQAARNLIAGAHWRKSGVPAPSAGNGTAMRAAPIGMFYFGDRDKLIECAHWQGYITHQDARCSAGSVLIAGAVALVITNDTIKVREFSETLSNWAKIYDAGFSGFVRELPDWIDLPPHDAIKIIANVGITEKNMGLWPGISPFVISSVLWSLYSFLKYPDNYWKAISTSICMGGDVDTTAAMTGAISGAFLGLEALPGHITKLLNDRGTWAYPELIDLADKCFEIVGKQ